MTKVQLQNEIVAHLAKTPNEWMNRQVDLNDPDYKLRMFCKKTYGEWKFRTVL